MNSKRPLVKISLSLALLAVAASACSGGGTTGDGTDPSLGGAGGALASGSGSGSGATPLPTAGGGVAGTSAPAGGGNGAANGNGGNAIGGNGGNGVSNGTGGNAVGGNAGAGIGDGGGGTGTGGANGTCDPGVTTTAWATSCPTAPPSTCVAGTWADPGSTTGDPKQCESDHFVVHSPDGTITQAQCTAATTTLESTIWPTFFGSPIFFPEPYCATAKKYKASIVIHSDYGLTGGGWGQGYMGMWVGPGATADHWGLAHEFTHAVQSQTKGLSCGGSTNYCGWIYESHANWHAQQIPEYHTSEVHCSEMLVNAPHVYLGSTRDRYCNWQFMEFLKDKYCYQAVNDIWNSTSTSNDPFTNIASTRGWSTSQLNDFFGEWAMHNVTWDYRDPPPTSGGSQGALYRSKYGGIGDTSKVERRLRTTRLEVLDAANRRYVVPTLQAPQRWGYDLIRLYPDTGATSVTVTFRGVMQSGGSSDWRWGLIATDAGITTPRYSALQKGADGQLTFCVDASQPLFLMVMGTPTVQEHVVWDALYPTVRRFPYAIGLVNAQPAGYQPNAPNPSPNGARWSNGGGWVASGATVAQGAYVGPFAAVLGGTVGATARIEDHAVITAGTVSSGTVGGLTVLPSGFTIGGSAKVAVAWPYGPGWFEHPQSVSGTAQLLGDLELRGVNQTESGGSYCGFVDSTIQSNCTAADITQAPPYAWRP